MTITIEEVYDRINGIRDSLILDTEHPAKEEIDEARERAALQLEGLAMEVRDLIRKDQGLPRA